MTDGTLRDSLICGNLYAALRKHLRDTGCLVFMNDVRVCVARQNAYYYPDVLATCKDAGRTDERRSTTVEDPKYLVEVMSDSTAATDKLGKLMAYRSIPSLLEYVLISQDEVRVEIHRRRGNIGWEQVEYTGVESVESKSVEMTMNVQDIHEGIPVQALERGPGNY